MMITMGAILYIGRIPTLKEICLTRISASIFTANISLQNVPYHLVREIFESAHSATDLELLMSRNSDVPGVDTAAEFQWKRFYNAKFWVGRSEPLALPEGHTWRSYYHMTEDTIRQHSEQYTASDRYLKTTVPKKKTHEATIMTLEESRKAHAVPAPARAPRGRRRARTRPATSAS
jgi:hypothetical protein